MNQKRGRYGKILNRGLKFKPTEVFVIVQFYGNLHFLKRSRLFDCYFFKFFKALNFFYIKHRVYSFKNILIHTFPSTVSGDAKILFFVIPFFFPPAFDIKVKIFHQ